MDGVGGGEMGLKVRKVGEQKPRNNLVCPKIKLLRVEMGLGSSLKART